MSIEEIVTNLFWFAAEQLRVLAHFAAPFLLLGSAAVWVIRERTAVSLSALAGALLFGGAELTHYLVPEVHGIAFNSRPPAADQNGFVYFLFIHGRWLGLAILGLATLLHFVRWKNHAE